jgi:hypothetical protein
MENQASYFSFWKDLTPSQAAFLDQNLRTEVFPQGKLIHRSTIARRLTKNSSHEFLR